jgi:multiple antibiotic resistance protein
MMAYIEAILALFAIVDPVGNIPVFLQITEHIPKDQRQRAFNISVMAAGSILLVFAFGGDVILNYVFHIKMADLQIAGGILLLVIAIEDLVFGSRRRPAALRGMVSAMDVACVPLACPLLAGPGAMVTSLAAWQRSEAGPAAAVVAIIVVLGAFWVMMRFIQPIQKIIGTLVSTVISKVMLVFIAAIGANMLFTGLSYYFNGK